VADKGMFTELMEASTRIPPAQRPAGSKSVRTPLEEPKPRPSPQVGPKPMTDNESGRSAASTATDALPPDLEDLGQVGYVSHSYRFSTIELRWLQRFCRRTSVDLDTAVSHNVLMRVLFRLAETTWSQDPDNNELRRLLTELLPR
jgi:hypothetical protein